MSHHCHAIGCEKPVPPRLLMCAQHWRMVPAHLQRLIWRVYRRGQEVTKTPSAVYLAAQAHVVAYVANAENVWTVAESIEHSFGTIQSLVEAERLTLDDFELLAQYDRKSFGETFDLLRRRSAS